MKEARAKIHAVGFLILLSLTHSVMAQPVQHDKGYELFYDGKLVGKEEAWNMRRSIKHFRAITEKYPNIKVEATFNGERLKYLTKVEVLPVFFVPRGTSDPTTKHKVLLRRHLSIARDRYREMLKTRDTFSFAQEGPLIYRSRFDLSQFRNKSGALAGKDSNAAARITTELLSHLNMSRFECPYILLVVVMNPHVNYPAGGGTPINGGVNTGGGIVVLSSYGLENSPQFQATLQHELGHSFGLCHVTVLGYDMKTNDSIMSYNPRHHWNGFKPPKNQGILIPENLKKLAGNKLVFPNFTFNPDEDIPAGYRMVEKRTDLVEMKLSQ